MANREINKVLIANRGEIAARVRRACDALGIRSAAICSEVDVHAWFARTAHELIVIGPAPARDSYLAIDKIVRAALDSGCDAVHPGYGFLSENAHFARAVEQAGLCFIGPTPEQIEILGSKTEARRRVESRGVPCVPGAEGGLSDEALIVRAREIGFPVIVKAVAGGGGRGMRVCRTEQEVRDGLPRARAEALKNFSSDDVFLEKFVENPRHVEVQLFGDSFGKVLHFGTRDCSAQRRHQKLVEEAPAPLLHPDLRERIHSAAVRAAESVSYRNAGTAEFLVKDNECFFLEMNTRIQVEHPVTEMVTGIDLVELQLRVARGEPLPYSQDQIRTQGHAIEFRIYAEDPERDFSPTRGKIEGWHRPSSEALREDFGYEPGDEISLFYDAMLSKVIVSGASRREAIDEAYRVLRAYRVEGIGTNVEFHRWLLLQPEFRGVSHDIGYLERRFNGDSIRELRAREVVDPLHQRDIGGAERIERFQVESITVEVVHEREGTFLAKPLAPDGVARPRSFWRRSNGLKTVLAAAVEACHEAASAR